MTRRNRTKAAGMGHTASEKWRTQRGVCMKPCTVQHRRQSLRQRAPPIIALMAVLFGNIADAFAMGRVPGVATLHGSRQVLPGHAHFGTALRGAGEGAACGQARASKHGVQGLQAFGLCDACMHFCVYVCVLCVVSVHVCVYMCVVCWCGCGIYEMLSLRNRHLSLTEVWCHVGGGAGLKTTLRKYGLTAVVTHAAQWSLWMVIGYTALDYVRAPVSTQLVLTTSFCLDVFHRHTHIPRDLNSRR